MITTMEKFEKENGCLYTVRDHDAVLEKIATRPGELTAVDFAISQYYGGASGEQRAREAHRKAQGIRVAEMAYTDPVQHDWSSVTPTPRPAVEPAATPTKWWKKYTVDEYNAAFSAAFERLLKLTNPATHAEAEALTLEDYRLLGRKVPAWKFHVLERFVDRINERNKERNARLDSAEARLATLESRGAIERAAADGGDRTEIDGVPYTKFIGSGAEPRMVRLEQAIEALTEENQTLRDRVGELEQRPAQKYVGLWQSGRKYVPGETITHDGSSWVCLSPTGLQPPNPSWQLAVRRGKPGRDGKDLRSDIPGVGGGGGDRNDRPHV